MVLSRCVSASVFRRSVSASARPPPSPRPFSLMPNHVTVVLRRSVSASARLRHLLGHSRGPRRFSHISLVLTLFLCQCPPSVLYKIIEGEAERRKGGVEPQCLCQRPPTDCSQEMEAKVERRNGGVEPQCLCQRPPFPDFDLIAFGIHFSQRC